MSWDIILPVAAVLAACWGVVSSIVMASRLQGRGEKINIVLFRLCMPRYVDRYRELTEQQTGRPGGLYFSFLVSMNLALLLFVMWILLRFVRT